MLIETAPAPVRAPAPVSPEEHLRRAYEAMDERGFCRGGYSRKGGSVCLMGSLVVTGFCSDASDAIWSTPEWEAVRLAVYERTPSDEVRVDPISWNDDHCKGKRDALALLARAREIVADA